MVLLAVLGLEAGLRLAGTGYPAGFLVDAPERPGFVRDNYKFAWRFFPKPLARASQPLMVAKDRPEDTLRIIVFGGSAAMGDPEPAYGLPRVLEVLLRDRFPGKQVEVINAAVTAINSHVVLAIARDCRQLDADAWIFYLGNNEVHGPFGAGTVFGGQGTPLWLRRASVALQRTRICQLATTLSGIGAAPDGPTSWGGMEMFLEHQIRHDDVELRRVYADFRRNLAELLDLAPASTYVLASTVVTNLKDSPPFVSLHTAEMTADELTRWDALFDAGCRAQASKDYQSALASFAAAAEIDTDFAELHFRMGQCHLEEDRASEAKAEFELARDLDALRFRADSTINNIIRSVADCDDGVILVDAERKIAEQSTAAIAGEEFLYEHVHFNFRGNYELARLFAEELAKSSELEQEFGQRASSNWLSPEACREQLGFTPYHELLIVQEMRNRLNRAPFAGQLNHDQRDARLAARARELSGSLTIQVRTEATELFEKLLSTRPQDWVLREQFALLLESGGNFAEAIDQFTKITLQLPHWAEGQFRRGALLNRAKQWTEAEAALRAALRLRPNFARAANSLGICLSHQDRFEECYAQFKFATELQPTFAEASCNWGLVLANQQDQDGAQRKFHEALAADEHYTPAHVELGKIYVAGKDYAAALPHYREIAKLRPSEAAAQLNLGMLYLRLQQTDAAVEQFRRTLEIDSGNQYALEALTRLGEVVEGTAGIMTDLQDVRP